MLVKLIQLAAINENKNKIAIFAFKSYDVFTNFTIEDF